MKEFYVGFDSATFDSFIRLSENLGELEITIGSAARPVIAELRARLIEAATLQKNGDKPAAVAVIRNAMERLARLAGTLDPAEAMLMRMVSENLTKALRLGDKDSAKNALNLIRHKAGDPKDDPNTDW